MKFRGFLYILGLLIIAIVSLLSDIFLMAHFGFHGQWLIYLYVVLGVLFFGAIYFTIVGLVPTILLDKAQNKITWMFIADEFYKQTKGVVVGDDIPFDEITACEINKKQLILKLKYGTTNILYLSAFTAKQVLKIKNEIESAAKLQTKKQKG